MNRQRLLTLAVAANAILTIVALIRIYTISNIIQTNLSSLSGNLQQLGKDVATLNEQVRRASTSVSDLTDTNLKAVHQTVTHLTTNLTSLDNSVANLQGFAKNQIEDHGPLSQSIQAFAGTLHGAGEQVEAFATSDGGPVSDAINGYRKDLETAGGRTLGESADGGTLTVAGARYSARVEAAGQGVADAAEQYRAQLKSAGQDVVKAGEDGGAVASAQSAYKAALATAGTKASDQVKDRLDRFFQDNQAALSGALVKKIDASCRCSCGPAAAVTKSP